MNKKILMSAAAAATLALTFTGCGSDVSSGASSAISGVAEKSALKNATVTIGSGTATTNANGEYTVSGATGTSITVSGGTYQESNSSGVFDVTNTVALSATTEGNANGAVNMGTTLVEQFVAQGGTRENSVNQVKALLGLSGEDNASIYGNVNDGSGNAKENYGRMIHQLLKDTASSSAGLTKVITTLQAKAATAVAASGNVNMTTALQDVYVQVALVDTAVTFTIPSAEIANFVTNIELPPAAFSTGIADGNATTAVNSKFAFSNVLVLDSNLTTATQAITSDVNLSRISDVNSSVSVTESTYDTNATGELLISLENLATSGINKNASYALRLNNLDVTLSGGYITALTKHTNTSAVATANSNMSKMLTVTANDANITSLLTTNTLVDADTGSGMDINVTAFTNFMSALIGTGEDETASANIGNGNFTSGMDANGTYEIKVLLDINDNNVTLSERFNLAPRASVNVGGSGSTAGTNYPGYKIVDANLTK